MTPLRAQMIRDMQLQRLAPQTQKAYVTAVAGWPSSTSAPRALTSEQIRTYLHLLLTERRLAWVPAIKRLRGSSSSIPRRSVGMSSTSTSPHGQGGHSSPVAEHRGTQCLFPAPKILGTAPS